ncbi:PF05872 family protein [Lachnoanaerobaculum sp. MSX33]|uniref:helicase HerA-like domain-containing protein n=1 Tax=Lachnoanaerobaculum sp. MSX33 TaxID=936596 RepID=UPI0003DFB646|nr:helicase HerA-like domain-containing protein [Lachnoanaerobaculum sp. MSX33]ETO94601.1 PF05872 family protein [Lachnoanaerobaculum sp. MSX33]
MYKENEIWVASDGDAKLCIKSKYANRHGLIAGATGTGKTVTLKVMAESFSDAGVPVFLSDIKGDLSGMCKPGEEKESITKRVAELGMGEDFSFKAYPTVFWDIFGKKGLPLRTTISEFGPMLLAKLLDLNQIQTDILNIIFKIADDEGLLLIDLKDLKSMLNYVSENVADYKAEYGNIAPQSVNAIMRGLVALGDKGGDVFFGEPALDINDWFVTKDGKGMINVLDATTIINDPGIYATFMLWMLAELFEIMPEVGDLDKPKMVFFFDEAHLLFKDTPKALLQKIEQVVKLIRSKGIGVYFITQNPSDIPDEVLAQLGNKVQHALRAYTPAEQKGIKAAAQSYRANPDFDTAEIITNLGIGEAVVSFIEDDGAPAMVRKAKVLPPQSYLGAIDDMMRAAVISMSDLANKYKDMVDRDSAYEFLQRLQVEISQKQEEERQAEIARKEAEKQAEIERKEAEKQAKAAQKEAEKQAREAEKEEKKKKDAIKKGVATVAGTAASTIGRQIGKTLGKSGGKFGSSLGGNLGASLGRGVLSTLFKLK